MQDNKLIACYIEQNPHYPGLDAARVKRYGVSVWSLIAHLRAVQGDVAQVAADYALPREAVDAALAYYRRHKTLIDARVTANVA